MFCCGNLVLFSYLLSIILRGEIDETGMENKMIKKDQGL